MYKDLKTLHPGGNSNPGFSVLEADAMTTIKRRQGKSVENYKRQTKDFSCNASIATSSRVRFQTKNIFLHFVRTL
jgi:hypothetical protein